ncbi:hypothetical protein SEVIR_1G340150v4 [Setaria viridis]
MEVGRRPDDGGGSQRHAGHRICGAIRLAFAARATDPYATRTKDDGDRARPSESHHHPQRPSYRTNIPSKKLLILLHSSQSPLLVAATVLRSQPGSWDEIDADRQQGPKDTGDKLASACAPSLFDHSLRPPGAGRQCPRNPLPDLLLEKKRSPSRLGKESLQILW